MTIWGMEAQSCAENITYRCPVCDSSIDLSPPKNGTWVRPQRVSKWKSTICLSFMAAKLHPAFVVTGNASWGRDRGDIWSMARLAWVLGVTEPLGGNIATAKVRLAYGMADLFLPLRLA